MATNTERKRRSTKEVRSLITEAAYAEFAGAGFDGTSIRSVAESAGVTESTVFRHFASKTELFRATAAGPLTQFMYEFATNITSSPGEDPRDVTLRFVSGLYDLCMANRRILQSLAAADTASENLDSAEEPAFEPCMSALADGVHRYMSQTNHRTKADVRNSVRMVLSLVLGATVNGRELFPREVGSESIKVMITDFVLSGADVGFEAPPGPTTSA